jgi:hypothetical protein
LVVTSLDQKHGVAGTGEPTGERTTAGAAADDDVLISEVGRRLLDRIAESGMAERCPEDGNSEGDEETERGRARHGRLTGRCGPMVGLESAPGPFIDDIGHEWHALSSFPGLASLVRTHL